MLPWVDVETASETDKEFQVVLKRRMDQGWLTGIAGTLGPDNRRIRHARMMPATIEQQLSKYPVHHFEAS